MKRKIQEQPVYIAFSFLIPLVILIIALLWLKVTPFGDKTLLIADANGLYINYLAYVGRLVQGQEGFLYSFEKGLGGNMLPNIGITMLNPFFSIFSGFESRNYPIAFTLVCVLNCSLAGLTMYLLLADCYGHKRSNLIFSTSYALMGFNVANVFQVFFFMGVHVLPLMALGLKKLLQGKSPLLYIFSIGYAVLTSYYFGFMICVASMVFFLLSLWLHSQRLSGKKQRLFFRYALSSICGGLMGTVIWLPSLLGISGGRLNQTDITSFSFQENMPLLEIISKLFTGANNGDELINGLPNIYVGILPVALVILFFLNRGIDNRNKTVAGVALGTYLLFFYIIAFNMVMHGGTVTNWFNYRYSFVFSFLMLIIASYEWQYLETISLADCKKCIAILLGVIVLVFSKRYGFVNGGEVLLDIALLLLMYLAFWMHRLDTKKNPQRLFELLILLICSFQLLLNFSICTSSLIGKNGWIVKLSDYQKTVDAVDPLVDGVQRGDEDFYRMEVNQQRSASCGNDPMLYGYDGVGHGGSVERNFVRTGLNRLGIHWYDMRNYYWEGIPAATDTLLGLRYIIAQENLSDEKSYTNATNYKESALFANQDNYDLYHNSDALSIAFLSEAGIKNVETDNTDIFNNLNRTWVAISGKDKPVMVEENDIHFCAVSFFDGLDILSDEARALTEKYDAETKASKEDPVSASIANEKKSNDPKERPEVSAYIEYSFMSKCDGPVYVYNRAGLNDIQGSYKPVLEYLGYYQKGDTVTGYISAATDYVNRIAFEEIAGRFRAAYADLDALHAASEAVRARPCTIEKIKDSHLRGEFTAEAGQLLMFTIPYDEGWTCFIDGKEAEIKQVLGVFMAIDAPAGTHSYEMKFFPVGMKTGIGLSAAALLTTLVYIPLDIRRRKRADAVPETAAAPECQTP